MYRALRASQLWAKPTDPFRPATRSRCRIGRSLDSTAGNQGVKISPRTHASEIDPGYVRSSAANRATARTCLSNFPLSVGTMDPTYRRKIGTYASVRSGNHRSTSGAF